MGLRCRSEALESRDSVVSLLLADTEHRLRMVQYSSTALSPPWSTRLGKINDAASQKTGSQPTEPHTRAISITEGFVLAQAIFRES